MFESATPGGLAHAQACTRFLRESVDAGAIVYYAPILPYGVAVDRDLRDLAGAASIVLLRDDLPCSFARPAAREALAACVLGGRPWGGAGADWRIPAWAGPVAVTA